MCLSIAVYCPRNVLASGTHEGFEWMVTNNGRACRCGYVRVPKGHPWHGKDDWGLAEVHGGITFAEADLPCDKPGEDDAWWIGFDCANLHDAPDPELPGFNVNFNPFYEEKTVKSQKYVENYCLRLCEQAAAATQLNST